MPPRIIIHEARVIFFVANNCVVIITTIGEHISNIYISRTPDIFRAYCSQEYCRP